MTETVAPSYVPRRPLATKPQLIFMAILIVIAVALAAFVILMGAQDGATPFQYRVTGYVTGASANPDSTAVTSGLVALPGGRTVTCDVDVNASGRADGGFGCDWSTVVRGGAATPGFASANRLTGADVAGGWCVSQRGTTAASCTN